MPDGPSRCAVLCWCVCVHRAWAWSINLGVLYAYESLNFVLPGQAPEGFKWARYSLGLVLYPIGAVCELFLFYKGLALLNGTLKYATMAVMGSYLIGAPAVCKHHTARRATHHHHSTRDDAGSSFSL
jgi:hypothetical protein